jgi:hypothetical protein
MAQGTGKLGGGEGGNAFGAGLERVGCGLPLDAANRVGFGLNSCPDRTGLLCVWGRRCEGGDGLFWAE